MSLNPFHAAPSVLSSALPTRVWPGVNRVSRGVAQPASLHRPAFGDVPTGDRLPAGAHAPRACRPFFVIFGAALARANRWKTPGRERVGTGDGRAMAPFRPRGRVGALSPRRDCVLTCHIHGGELPRAWAAAGRSSRPRFASAFLTRALRLVAGNRGVVLP